MGTLIEEAWGRTRFPKIQGGQAVWALSSNIPLAVATQQWSRPKVLPSMCEEELKLLDVLEDQVRLHWSYLEQEDPELVLRILDRLKLNAVPD